MRKFFSILLVLSSVGIDLYAQTDRDRIALLQQQVNELNERVDGLTTLIEGFNSTIYELQKNQSSLKILEGKIDRVRVECTKERDLSVESRSDSQVTPNQVKNSEHNNKNSESTKSNATLYREGAQFFQKKQYEKAKNRFLLMVEKNYKSASSNYYLGEIAYYTNKYSDAIYYFKKSAKLYDKASYIDTLMLHTAISLEKSGDKSQAKIFYQTIINDYPNKKSATIAQKQMQKI